ncbi:hypothetical protein KO361_06295 [Candidatus Woesearchaeota archaeon]|nr:hypothetical protein [Candidatus Woesearchaeota archaeon]
MEVKEAIECLEVASEFQVSINRQEEIKRVISLLKSLEAENKVYRNEQSGWVKEIERRQAKIRELEKLDLNVRELMLENKKLKEENKAYKEMWNILKIAYDTELYGLKNLTLKKVMEDFEFKYLGGGE